MENDLAYDLINDESNFWISSFPEFAFILHKFNKDKYDEMIAAEVKMEDEGIYDLQQARRGTL